MNGRYIEIFSNGDTFSVSVRWNDTDEQHEGWEFNNIQEVNAFLEKWYDSQD